MVAKKLDSEMHKRIVACIERGLTYARTSQACGIGYSTFKQWMARGRQEKRGMYKDLAAAVKKADAMGEAWHLDNIKKHASKTWQASAWFLERKFPERWAKRDWESSAEQAKNMRISKEDVQKAMEEIFKN